MPSPPVHVSLVAIILCGVLTSVVVIGSESAANGTGPAVDHGAGAEADQPAAESPLHPIVLHSHPTPRIATGIIGEDGHPVTISCSTCHSMLEPDPKNTAADLDLFHHGIHFQHGTITCLSCHNRNDYDSLVLADGRSVAYESSIDLCSQCHGIHRRDFDRGAHGGMTGYWDLTRGGRVRNTCVDCHDAHAPKYQGAIPVPGPRSRFQQRAADRDGAAHE